VKNFDSELTKDFYEKIEAITKSNIDSAMKQDIIDDLSIHADNVLVWAVTFYDGDAQNGGTCHFWTYEDAELEIENMKDQLNGWTSRIADPEAVSLNEADIHALLEAME
jgi:hypothetical protein